ncbi:MAG: hypothetical protein Q9160_001686 [Pyrenula sp. 1 TL-2023]
MHIQSIPMWVGSSNNYAYIVSDSSSKDAVLIDPANPSEVAPVVKEQVSSGKIKLTAIVNTHHHWDHAGGNEEMLKHFPGTPVIGGKDCAHVTRTPAHSAAFRLGKSIEITPLHTPCHTQDSICYYFSDPQTSSSSPDTTNKAVFTGDTLFIGGCGKFFEGSAAEMHKALNVTLAALPDDTRVYPGHEYTKSNAKFLVKVDGENKAIKELEKYANDNRETQGRFTIGDEKKHNVFMRVKEEEMKKATGEKGEVDVLGKLREMKNSM